MVAKRERWTCPDVKQIETDLQGTDEGLRSKAVGGLCPCHAGWEVFEKKVDTVIRSLRDPSRVVRRSALHVLDDAAVMQSREDLKYYLEPVEERMDEKRHFRPMERRLEARAKRRIERRKKRNRTSHRDYGS